MGNIISLDDKLGLSEKKKREILRRRKYIALQKVFQCTRCSLKCEKCGVQISDAHQRRIESDITPNLPYRFCEGCMDEYLDYINRLKGTGDPDYYWHNGAWMESWKLWIDYQGTIDRFLKSKEFKRLVRDVNADRTET